MSDPTSTHESANTKLAPARRFGGAAVILIAVGSAALAGSGSYLLGRSTSHRPEATSEAPSAPKARYQCPMHPSVIRDQPGKCPICGMELVKMGEPDAAASSPTGAAERRILYYRAPMDPKITSPIPKKDPMGMDYVPVYADEIGGEPSGVSGLATVDIDPARQQLIGLATAWVTAGPVGGAWRTVGRVAQDETRVAHVNVKVSGFVEHVYVNYVGKSVRRGDRLFSVYSPELLSAQQEYLLALRTRGALSDGGSLASDGDALVTAARRKLSLWDIPDAEIDQIAKTGEATKTLTFTSPASGVVTKKDVVEGMRLEAGAMPYEIVDLSQVWVLADVYENELAHVKVGMPASLTLNAFPNREFMGNVLFLDPLLDPQTRTAKVRLAFPNPSGDLRPEMFGEVVLHGTPREGLRIPQDAVIDSGTEKIVFVALGNGKFQPRKVHLGDVDGGNVEVESGLSQGEQVVTRANFLVDSESRLRASLAEMSVAGPKAPENARVLPGAADAAAPTHAGHVHPDGGAASHESHAR